MKLIHPPHPVAASLACYLALALAPLPQAYSAKNEFGMSPPATPEIVAAAAALPILKADGPYQPTWDSLRKNYKVPQWFLDAKFGITMHWGLFSVPAYHNEWYEKHMYAAFTDWHAQNFGPQDKFGYKDFIPMFTAAKFDPNEWADLFKKSGAKYVVPTCEHHDWFSLWDSKVSPWNAMQMGPKRDLIGEMSVAMRKQGLKFGVCNHSIEHYTFINPKPGLKTDLDDPKYADFYWTNRNDQRVKKFMELWIAKNIELIDKYKLDILWFDNGVNPRLYDPLKLKVAAYFYNRALQWGKEVTIDTKDSAYPAGSVLDFEKAFRGPKGILEGAWEAEDVIGNTWGYTKGEKFRNAQQIVTLLIETVSKNGNLLLNLSPEADGTISQAQRDTLLGVGKWLAVNGEAIYGTHSWITPVDDAGVFRFTVKGDDLYAIGTKWPGEQAVITSLAAGKATEGKIKSITMLGRPDSLSFSQDGDGLKIKLQGKPPSDYAFALKITGLKMNPPGPRVPAVAEHANKPPEVPDEAK